MKQAIIFGAGNVGSMLIEKIPKDKINIKYIVRSNGIFNLNLNKISEKENWKSFIDEIDVAFISMPTIAEGKEALEYSLALLEKGKKVITCEKASLAHNWDLLRKYKDILKYTAAVGGGTKMLKEFFKLSPDKILEIKGVVNGTLNYLSDALKKGKDKEEITKEILEKGFSEPGANSFEEIIKTEMNDVLLKTIIIANHSRVFDRTITKKDVEVVFPSNEDFVSKRCVVEISREKISCGFIEDTNAGWLSEGVNNVLYINGKKKAFGPGAGAEATALAMIGDFYDLNL